MMKKEAQLHFGRVLVCALLATAPAGAKPPASEHARAAPNGVKERPPPAAAKGEPPNRVEAPQGAEKSAHAKSKPEHPAPGAGTPVERGARPEHAPGESRQGASARGLAQRQAGSAQTRAERRKQHHEALRQRWGATLAEPPVREELAHHARRMAFLKRALELVHSDTKSKDTVKVVARIEKLIERENARHDRAMTRFAARRVAGAQGTRSKGGE